MAKDQRENQSRGNAISHRGKMGPLLVGSNNHLLSLEEDWLCFLPSQKMSRGTNSMVGLGSGTKGAGVPIASRVSPPSALFAPCVGSSVAPQAQFSQLLPISESYSQHTEEFRQFGDINPEARFRGDRAPRPGHK